jgi:hypothetical protein
MQLRILTDPADLGAVRALALSMVPPDRAAALLPDALIQGPAIGYKAETLVIRRVGPDWTAILAGNAPPAYAGGDQDAARALLIGAAVLYCCVHLCPMLRQIVPTAEKSEVISTTWAIDWTELAQSYTTQAQEALGLLLPTTAAPALTMARPGVSLIDPDAPPWLFRHRIPRY